MTRARRLSRSAAAITAAVAVALSAGCTGPSSDAVAADLDRRIAAFLDASYTDAFDRVRAVLVTAHGKPVVERYYTSDADTPGNIQSVTKTVVATLVGIALDEGKLRSVDQPLGELLPAYAHLMTRDVKAITLHQLLTTTAGLRPGWPGQPPHFVTARDWVAAILADAATVYDLAPGFTQAQAESHLLSAILVAATGRPMLDYAREKLFDPLGIDTYPAAEPAGWPGHIAAPEGFAWPTDPQGHHVGFAGLTLTARDMAKLGRLWLDEGRWEGRQLVSAAWVEEATQQHVITDGESGFGYQWWVTTADGHPAYAALGSGGQLLEVVPALGLVVVVSSTQAVGNAEADSYLELVATHIAPAVAR